MKSLVSKILWLEIISVLVAFFSIGIFGLLSAINFSKASTRELQTAQTNREFNKIDSQLFQIEHDVNVIKSFMTNTIPQIKDFGGDIPFENYTSQLKQVLYSISSRNNSIISSYVHFYNPVLIKEYAIFFKIDRLYGIFHEEKAESLDKYGENDIEKTGWFWIPAKNGDAIWLKPYYDATLNEVVISYNVPIYFKNSIIAVAGMDLAMSTLKDIISNSELYDEGFSILMGKNGECLFHADYPNGLSRDMFKLIFKSHDNKSLNSSILNYKNKLYLTTVCTLRNGMSLILAASLKDMFRPLEFFLKYAVIIAAILFILTVSFTWHFALRVTKPLRELINLTNKVAQGDYSVTIKSNSKDEVGLLANTFGHTVAELNRHVGSMNRIAYIDVLTGLKNKTAYTEAVALLNTKLMTGEVNFFAVIVMDVNDLKKVNDTFGHVHGDMLIMDAGKIIKLGFNETVPAYRIGGDEFVVIIENIKTESELNELLEKFDKTLAAERLKNKENNEMDIVIARGGAIFNSNIHVTFDDVFNMADAEMYKNKALLKKQTAIEI